MILIFIFEELVLLNIWNDVGWFWDWDGDIWDELRDVWEGSGDVFLVEVWLWCNGCKGDFIFDDWEVGIVWFEFIENIFGRSVLVSYIYVNLCIFFMF